MAVEVEDDSPYMLRLRELMAGEPDDESQYILPRAAWPALRDLAGYVECPPTEK